MDFDVFLDMITDMNDESENENPKGPEILGPLIFLCIAGWIIFHICKNIGEIFTFVIAIGLALLCAIGAYSLGKVAFKNKGDNNNSPPSWFVYSVIGFGYFLMLLFTVIAGMLRDL